MTDTTMRIVTTFYTSMTYSVRKRLATSKFTMRSGDNGRCQWLTLLCRNRYLILDVLGQGTFGQVVKCQNLKTQEVVAVKVIKNRTAYFNQSMMEVSVLDLVSSLSPLCPMM